MDIWTYIPDKGINLLKETSRAPATEQNTQPGYRSLVQSLHTEQDISNAVASQSFITQRNSNHALPDHTGLFTPAVFSHHLDWLGPLLTPLLHPQRAEHTVACVLPYRGVNNIWTTGIQSRWNSGREPIWVFMEMGMEPSSKATAEKDIPGKRQGKWLISERMAQGLGIQMETMRTGQILKAWTGQIT